MVMKRLISLTLAAMLVSYCGTAPHAELQGDSRMTTGEEEQGDSKTSHYAVVGGVVTLVALCTVIPGAKRVCQKQFKSADKYKKGLQDTIDQLRKDEVAEGISDEAAKKINKKITNLEDLQKADNAGKDGILYAVYDKTIGALGRKFKKADEAGQQADEAGQQADEAGQQADEAGQQADEAADKNKGGKQS